MRREFIYPHRAVRAVNVSRWRALGALVTAATVSGLTFWKSSFILDLHSGLTQFLLRLARIPFDGVRPVQVFQELAGTAAAPEVAFQSYGQAQMLPGILVLIAGGALAVIYGRFPLLRGMVLFLGALLAAGVATLWLPNARLDGVTFHQVWLRSEGLVWLILPWMFSFLLVLGQPAWSLGLAMTLAATALEFFWSAARLAFCLGLLHYAGNVLMPLAWFCLGLLTDVVFVVACYSIVIFLAAGGAWGRRRG